MPIVSLAPLVKSRRNGLLAADWAEPHRWALAFGTLLISMLAGFLGSQLWPRIDLIAKIVMNVIAVVLMLRLRRTVWRGYAERAS